MDTESNSESDPENRQPTEGELWTCLYESDSGRSRFAVARVDDTTVGEDGDLLIDMTVLYDNYAEEGFYDLGGGHQMWEVPEHVFHAPLPDHDEWDDRFEDCVDILLDYFTPREAAGMLAGDPSHITAGRRGYEAARFVILDSVNDSITEFSIHHGHGPSRYSNALASRVSDLPDWLARLALESEKQRWDGGLAFDAETASYLVEVLLVENEILGTDNDEEITELVNEFNLPYDEYIRGRFTAHDCPTCGEELIERPEDEDGYIVLDCSSCDAQFEGVLTDEGLIVEKEITDEDDEN